MGGMDFAFQVLGYLFAIPLGVLTIRALLRGEYRHYPILLLYLVVDLLTSVLEILTRALPIAESREATDISGPHTLYSLLGRHGRRVRRTADADT